MGIAGVPAVSSIPVVELDQDDQNIAAGVETRIIQATDAPISEHVYQLGLIGFAILPAYQDASPVRALVLGLIFGCFTYATYDLTNQATLRNWTTILTVTDVIWGSALAACCAWSGYIVANRLLETP